MKYKLYFLIIISLPQLSLNAKCPYECGVSIWNNGIATSYNKYDAGIPIVAFISPGDSISFGAHVDMNCPGPNEVTIFYNGNTIFSSYLSYGNLSMHLTVYDSGHYLMDAEMNGIHKIFDVTVSYSIGTEIQNNPRPTSFQIIPSISSGIFKINSSERILKQILVANSRGYIVIQTTKNISVINITDFSSGIYYYAITDEKENVFRGKIVKY